MNQIRDFRRANLARVLRYTITLLLLGLGARETAALLDAYFDAHPPEPFAAVEAEQFARYLSARLPLSGDIGHLEEVLSFEHALLRAAVFGQPSEIRWTVEPTALLESLEAGRLPAHLVQIPSTMRVSAV